MFNAAGVSDFAAQQFQFEEMAGDAKQHMIVNHMCSLHHPLKPLMID